ncbi:MAG: glutathione synthase [gamma proteobacterium symbiont of Bathyaustriella thionipta]|nr:glutathione synthase [gamma proteobacterium symbiont of Bathyaustriella thionipta]MCU7949893.1 glutathione synthase [gamma proteobacterium symbiont of Bathyaustriella thionipta]MCU7954073.1 glutathione synthase [gamma proteobacterium symbiont of Bathyaustriella thionipta]MCU7956490.1 glutathione synthase [gamma proteobacterium symbiont of Bathyaustriella thionipta]MCU7968568.1 glutathione synthase [gamma proteobacterium symbiont of Bathyaustriella thionipta]
MPIKLGIVMDPIQSINIKKDSSFAMLLEAQHRDYEIYYMEMSDLFIENNQAKAYTKRIRVFDDPNNWYQFISSAKTDNSTEDKTDDTQRVIKLSELDSILMRKDPPFDMEYIYATYILEIASQSGTLVVNNPQSLRDANEKLFTHQFPSCTVPTLVSRNKAQFKQFLKQHHDIIVKPLGGMGGHSIFRVKENDPNINVILETVTNHASQYIMAQRFIPEISRGDKRILIINGIPVDYALARIPPEGETRGNLAAGGTGQGIPLSERDYWLCEQVAPRLKEMGLIFVGMDVIGDYITEINVTSPTCIRELDSLYNLNISALLMDVIEDTLAGSTS